MLFLEIREVNCLFTIFSFFIQSKQLNSNSNTLLWEQCLLFFYQSHHVSTFWVDNFIQILFHQSTFLKIRKIKHLSGSWDYRYNFFPRKIRNEKQFKRKYRKTATRFFELLCVRISFKFFLFSLSFSLQQQQQQQQHQQQQQPSRQLSNNFSHWFVLSSTWDKNEVKWIGSRTECSSNLIFYTSCPTSLSLSPLSQSVSNTHSLSLTNSLCLSHTLPLSLSITHILSHILSHTLSHTLSLFLTHSHTHLDTRSLAPIHCLLNVCRLFFPFFPLIVVTFSPVL